MLRTLHLHSSARASIGAVRHLKHASALHATTRPAVDATRGVSIDSSQTISWYPGHIAKAERELTAYLRKVDVVIEVRDARIPLSTTHPMVPKWVGNKPLIVAVTRIDQVTPQAVAEWQAYFARNQIPLHSHGCGNNLHTGQPTDNAPPASHVPVFFIDSKQGAGISALKSQALLAAAGVNERRQRLGIQPRAVRAAIIGFPNVGKSALINRILGKKKAVSKDMPGVTRSMQWIRISGTLAEQTADGAIELLDSPGIIPASHLDQHKATHLAICNDIGEASYDRAVVAGIMCDKLVALHSQKPSFVDMNRIEARYGLPLRSLSGEDIVLQVADKYFHGNATSAADRLLGDFRKGHYGLCSLEAPPAARAGNGGSAGKAVYAATPTTTGGIGGAGGPGGAGTDRPLKSSTRANAGREGDVQPGGKYPADVRNEVRIDRGRGRGASDTDTDTDSTDTNTNTNSIDATTASDRAGEKHFSFSFSAKEGKFDNW